MRYAFNIVGIAPSNEVCSPINLFCLLFYFMYFHNKHDMNLFNQEIGYAQHHCWIFIQLIVSTIAMMSKTQGKKKIAKMKQ